MGKAEHGPACPPPPRTFSSQPDRRPPSRAGHPPRSPPPLSAPARVSYPQLTSWVNLGKPLNLSEPQFPCLQNGVDDACLKGWEGDEVTSSKVPSLPPSSSHPRFPSAPLTLGKETWEPWLGAAAHLTTVGILHHKAQAVVGLEGILQCLWGRKAAMVGGGKKAGTLLILQAHTPPTLAATAQTSALSFGVHE